MNVDFEFATPDEHVDFSGKSLASELAELKVERPSNLSPDLLRLTESEEFKRWFEDSKLVDENGDPQVFYHGGASGVASYSRDAPRNTGQDQFGYYFSPKENTAKFYAEKHGIEEIEQGRSSSGSLYRVFLRSKLPYVVEPLSGVRSQGINELPQGFDSYVNNASSEVVVFDPSQIYIIDERSLSEIRRGRSIIR